MTKQDQCPKSEHFHVSANDVFEIHSFSKIVEATDPNSALSIVINELDSTWEGSIEIEDHENFGTCQVPLIDFWRTPK